MEIVRICNKYSRLIFKDEIEAKRSSGLSKDGYDTSQDGLRPNNGGPKSSGESGKKPALKIGIVLPRQIFQQRRYQVKKGKISTENN